MSDLQRTPLYSVAIEHRARLTAFAGWEMPVQFTGLTTEHQAVRQRAGMFDISHMGKFMLPEAGSLAKLQALVPSDLSRLQPGQAQYTVLLNDRGGVIDDIIVYCEAEGRGVVIVNAATKDKDLAWMQSHLPTLEDHSSRWALVAVQGPEAIASLHPLVQELAVDSLGNFGHGRGLVLGAGAFIARTGYTGEDGLEVMLPAAQAIELWQRLSAMGVQPCGLGARDTLRLEAAMCLYGQELGDDISPLEAGLNWLVHWDKGDFIGRSVLEQQRRDGLQRKLVGLTLGDRHIARHDYPIYHQGQAVGVVTSGTLSPTLGYPIALGFVPPALGTIGQQVEVEIRGKHYPAQVVKKPFYRSSRR
jgi:aminomethyltransferase